MDSNSSDCTFEDFCWELGYDTDSRKALETYLSCQENGSKLRKAIPSAVLAELSEVLEDY